MQRIIFNILDLPLDFTQLHGINSVWQTSFGASILFCRHQSLTSGNPLVCFFLLWQWGVKGKGEGGLKVGAQCADQLDSTNDFCREFFMLPSIHFRSMPHHAQDKETISV